MTSKRVEEEVMVKVVVQSEGRGGNDGNATGGGDGAEGAVAGREGEGQITN